MRWSRKIALAAVAAALLSHGLPLQAAPDPEAVMAASCSGCHVRDQQGHWSRISEQRKTPEGWQMTLTRMQLVHGARITDPGGSDEAAATRALVQYLADEQGLTPEESAPWRYILERELNRVEEHESTLFAEMCARCHSGARVALQRRSEAEWRHLVHFHLGQFPSAEYSLMGRDRDWLGIALNEMVPYLSERFALDSEVWRQWRQMPRLDLSGRWRIAGSMPGKGLFNGVMTASGEPPFRLQFDGEFASGEPLAGTGTAVVYSGHEWRASLTLNDAHYQQVMAASADGDVLRGRMFLREREEWGLRLQARRDDGGGPRVLAVQPAFLQAGGEQQVRIVGTGLAGGDIDLGDDVEVVEVLQRDDDTILLRARAAAGAAPARYPVRVGGRDSDAVFTLFQQVDRIAVEPAYAVARVGGNGGSQPVVEAMFDAVGFSNGADGEAGTDDDLRIGVLPAQWSVAPFDAQAEVDEDVRFAGQMDADAGIFTPAAAGPNPARKYQTNNAGNLRVQATLANGDDAALEAKAQLIVTVQRWNNPPIR